MKNNLLLAIAVSFAINNAYSQCSHAIPQNANVVNNGTLLIDGGFTPQWVCNGDTLHEEGGIFNVFMEDGAVMNIHGGIDTVYVKNGATLNMFAGIIKVLYYEPSAILNTTNQIVQNSVLCPSIQFDYTNAPANKCKLVTVAGIDDAKLERSLTIAPNPNNGVFSINYSDKQISSHIEICNALGAVVYETETTSPTNSVDLSNLPKGIYFVKVSSKNESLTNKILLQ